MATEEDLDDLDRWLMEAPLVERYSYNKPSNSPRSSFLQFFGKNAVKHKRKRKIKKPQKAHVNFIVTPQRCDIYI
jgi:hypothetical protein